MIYYENTEILKIIEMHIIRNYYETRRKWIYGQISE